MILQGHVLDVLPTLPSESVHCIVTSPPYWGLRDYGIEPQIWGGESTCEHRWAETEIPNGSGSGKSFRRDRSAWHHRGETQPGFCIHCGAWRGSFGLEPTPELYVEHSVMIFREARRVLRDDGVLWLNLGDSYATGAGKVGLSPGGGEQGKRWLGQPVSHLLGPIAQPNRMPQEGLKPKDLCMMPFRVAMALQADGWYLRAVCPWLKRNAMPESCKDRPTQAVEYIFLLTKSQDYYYDHEAVKLRASPDTHARYGRGRSDNHKYADGGPGRQTIAMTFDHMRAPGVNPKSQHAFVRGWQHGKDGHSVIGHNMPKDAIRSEQDLKTASKFGHGPGWRNKQNESFSATVKDVVGSRARRNSDWFFESWQGLLSGDDGDPLAFIINPRPFKGAHFATFPETMVEPCIKAGTSEKGCCPDYGAPWERVKLPSTRYAAVLGKSYHDHPDDLGMGMKSVRGANGQNKMRDAGIPGAEYVTTGWRPTCWHYDERYRSDFSPSCRPRKFWQKLTWFDRVRHRPGRSSWPVIPCSVLDFFGGSGTVGLVAERMDRDWITIELNSQYVRMQHERLRNVMLGLFGKKTLDKGEEP